MKLKRAIHAFVVLYLCGLVLFCLDASVSGIEFPFINDSFGFDVLVENVEACELCPGGTQFCKVMLDCLSESIAEVEVLCCESEGIRSDCYEYDCNE